MPGGAADLESVAGSWGLPASGDRFLRDPRFGEAVALLADATGRLPETGTGIVVGILERTPTNELPTLHAEDALPSFWRQPSVWGFAQQGPAAFAGRGREPGFREWAGRPAFDRRGSPLDPGWSTPFVSSGPSGSDGPTPGRLGARREGATVVLTWSVRGGRRYAVEFSRSLEGAFSELRAVDAPRDAMMSLSLPLEGGQGYYRIAELSSPPLNP